MLSPRQRAEARRRRNSDAKIRIARAATDFAKPGHTIALDAGSTTLELTRFLGDVADLRIIQRSDQVIALCDASKFNRQAMVRIAALNEVHYFIVDTAPPEALRAAIERAGAKIIVAQPQ